MKKIILMMLLVTTSSFAAEYVCSPANPKNPDQSKYTVIVYKKTIQLGFLDNDLKNGTLESNRNQNYLRPYLQFGGNISKLRGEGYLKAYISPMMTTAASSGVMYLEWARNGLSLVSRYSCKKI